MTKSESIEKHGRQIEQALKEDAQKHSALKIAWGEKCLNKWENNEVGSGLGELYAEDASKARYTAIMLENEENHLEQLSEAIVSQNFQTTPENVLKIVRIGSANSNRGEIFTEVPLSTVDDAIYFVEMNYETALRDATANAFIYETLSVDETGEETYKDTTASATTQFSITLDNTPVIPNKIIILLNGVYVGSDAGSSGTTGTITGLTDVYSGAKLTASPTTGYQAVVYATGVVTLEFDQALTASDTIRIIYHYDTENSGLFAQLPTLTMSVRKQRFEARPLPLGFNYSQMTEVTLGTTTGLDAEALLVGGIGDEMAKVKDYKAVRLANALAKKNQTYTFDTDFAANGEISYKNRAQLLGSKIDKISGDLHNTIKRGRANKAIVGTDMLTYMKLHNSWVDDLSQKRNGMYKAGRFSDLDVYVCPVDSSTAATVMGLATTDALLTYKNPDEGMDIVLAFGVLTELSASLMYPQMYKQGYLASVEDALVLEDRFCRKLSLLNFSTSGL